MSKICLPPGVPDGVLGLPFDRAEEWLRSPEFCTKQRSARAALDNEVPAVRDYGSAHGLSWRELHFAGRERADQVLRAIDQDGRREFHDRLESGDLVVAMCTNLLTRRWEILGRHVFAALAKEDWAGLRRGRGQIGDLSFFAVRVRDRHGMPLVDAARAYIAPPRMAPADAAQRRVRQLAGSSPDTTDRLRDTAWQAHCDQHQQDGLLAALRAASLIAIGDRGSGPEPVPPDAMRTADFSASAVGPYRDVVVRPSEPPNTWIVQEPPPQAKRTPKATVLAGLSLDELYRKARESDSPPDPSLLRAIGQEYIRQSWQGRTQPLEHGEQAAMTREVFDHLGTFRDPGLSLSGIRGWMPALRKELNLKMASKG